MPRALLITQCLQADFVLPIGRHDPLPNLLHVGHAEARRLCGPRPEEGPVARAVAWARQQPAEDLCLVHIRDWHDPEAPRQADHLRRFGAHCLAGSPGARFVFPAPDPDDPRERVVNALTLNDFLHSDLEGVLAPLAEKPLCVGLIGVWTEAKITFLAYELRTRYPAWRLGTCSALTASASRSQHFIALDLLQRLLQVEVFPSLGGFLQFLGGTAPALPLAERAALAALELSVEADPPLSAEDEDLVRYLFRDCCRAGLRALGGGYSGNRVLLAGSEDRLGHQQAPHVVKLGPRDPIAQERTAFERIEAVLGNSAPRISDFADLGQRGAIKYRYASMGGGEASTFKARYEAGAPQQEVDRLLQTVFGEQLGRLYAAAQLETCDLLDYYQFSPRWAESVARKVAAVAGAGAGETLAFAGGRRAKSVARFYGETLAALPKNRPLYVPFAFVHGDLNGANIVLDGQENVWLIDFFHTHRGHVLRDLIKLENDLLYIFTPLSDEGELEQALALCDLLLGVQDLAAPLAPLPPAVTAPALRRAYATLRTLRGFYPDLIGTARDPLQLLVGQLRYAVHTLGFDESGPLQKRWALYAACRQAELVGRQMAQRDALRVDWLDGDEAAPGRLGITILPGRRDFGRDLGEDLKALREQGVTHVLCLLSDGELSRQGVGELMAAYRGAGLTALQRPVVDQAVPAPEEMAEMAAWIEQATDAGAKVMVHCQGGLGRSGTVAACFLKSRGLSSDQALERVRRARTPRAVESPRQEAFVRSWSQSR